MSKVTVTEKEKEALKNYIERYCQRQENVEFILNELIGNGHTEANDPFVKYMVPIMEVRIELNEYRELIKNLTEQLRYLNMEELKRNQRGISERIKIIEDILLNRKINNKNEVKGEDNSAKESKEIISIILFIVGIFGILGGITWWQLRSIPVQNHQEHQTNAHGTFHKFDIECE